MTIQLSDHFTYKKLLRFTLPSVVMMIFSSIYGVVDGIFVSNFAGTTAFAAVNLIMPYLMIWSGVAFMVGTGGSALVAKTMGEGDTKKANDRFSLLVTTSILASAVFAALSLLFLKPVTAAFGAEGQMFEDCVTYAWCILPALPFFFLQMLFQSFLVVAQKPNFGLAVTVAAGVTNMVLDFLLVGVLDLGLVGAGLATAFSQAVGGVIPLFYFLFSKKAVLKLRRFRFERGVIWRACFNGSSEMMTNISMSVVNMLYNARLMALEGERGVAAYGVIMYVAFVFVSAFIGYTVGCSPIISYHFGAKNRKELRSLHHRNKVIIAITSAFMVIFAFAFASPFSRIFASQDEALLKLTIRAFYLYSPSFILAGINIYGSAFFTALGDGLVSAIISFARMFLFEVIFVSILPLLLGIDGIWLTVVFVEIASFIVVVSFFMAFRQKYGYGKEREVCL